MYVSRVGKKSLYNLVKYGSKAYKVGAKVGKYLREYNNSPYKQPTIKKSIVRKRKAFGTPETGPGKSAGFLKRGNKKRKVIKAKTKGVVCNFENGGTATSTTLVFVGHHSTPATLCLKLIAYSIVRKMMQTMGNDAEGFNVAHGLPAANLFILNTRNYLTAVGTGTTYADTSTALTWADVADGLISVLNLANAEQTELVESLIIINGIASRVSLFNAKIHFHFKSTLKLQNRSVPSAEDDNIDEVDNVPLFGKSYSGYGNGISKPRGFSRLGTDAKIMANGSTGVINRNGVDTQELLDIDDGGSFPEAKWVGKCKLDPGELKTSTLITKRAGLVTQIFRKSVNASVIATTEAPTDFGHFRLFSLEKMLEIVADRGSRPSISVAYEHNIVCSAYLTHVPIPIQAITVGL